MSYHNLCQMKNYINQVSALVEMCCDVPDLTRHIFPAKIARNIDVIIEAFNNMSSSEEIINRKFVALDRVDEVSSLEDFFE